LAGGTSTGCADATGTSARFSGAAGGNLTYLKGYLYYFDVWCYARLARIDVTSGVVVTVAGGSSYGNVDGTGTAAQFGSANTSERRPLATDGQYIYISDIPNGTIRRLDPVSLAVTTVSGVAPRRQDINGLYSSAAMYNDPTALYFGLGRALFGNSTGLRRASP